MQKFQNFDDLISDENPESQRPTITETSAVQQKRVSSFEELFDCCPKNLKSLNTIHSQKDRENTDQAIQHDSRKVYDVTQSFSAEDENSKDEFGLIDFDE